MSDPRRQYEDAMLADVIRREELRLSQQSGLSAERIHAVTDRLLGEKSVILADFDKTPALSARKKTPGIKVWAPIGVAALTLIGVGVLFLNRGADHVDARLAYVKGIVKVNGAAAMDTPVAQGTVLSTEAKTLASVRWSTAGTTVLGQNARVQVLKLAKRDIPLIEIENTGGLAFTKVQKGAAHFTVRTPTVILTVQGTGFSVHVTSAGTTIKVQEGVVEATLATKPGSPIKVGARQKLSLRVQGEPQVSALNDVEMAQLARLEKVATGLATDAIATEIFADEVNPTAPDGTKPVVKLTLDDIRKKYGKISRVNLKSGASYTGFFVLKGEKIEIITPNGVVRVPTEQLRDVQDIN